MKPQRRTHLCLALLSSVAMLAPPSFLLATPREKAEVQTPASYSTDIALSARGVLRGSVVDALGAPVAHTRVVVSQSGQTICDLMTDENGDFEVGGLRGGVVVVATPGGSFVCRLWAGNTAPPAAHDRLLLIDEASVVRGQYTRADALGDWMSQHPAMAYSALTAAIVVPIIIADRNNDPPAS